MTDPIDNVSKSGSGSKSRMIWNIVLLVLNIVICGYLFQQSKLILLVLFAVLALRNAFIVYTIWRTA